MRRAPFRVFLIFVGLVSAAVAVGEGRTEVVVFDRLTTTAAPVYLKVQTKGRFFPEGGRRVQIRIGAFEPRTVLSGADGLAYLKFEPRQSGISEIEATSGTDRGLGHLLVIPPQAPVGIVGVAHSLKLSVLSDRERKASQAAIETLAKRFHIVYVTEWVPARSAKEWLAQKKYPLSVVLRWQGRRTLEMLKRRQITVAVIVGSEAMLKAAGSDIEYRYSFEKSRHGRTVSDWNEIEAPVPSPAE
jgi:hypothetical protein